MALLQEDDLFRQSSMTFGEHLEDLRKHLFRAFLWLGLGLIIGFVVGQWVVGVIKRPLETALGDYYQKKALEKLKSDPSGFPPEAVDFISRGYLSDQWFVDPGTMVDELKRFAPGAATSMNSLVLHHLSAKDLTDAKDLAKKLVEASQSEQPTAARHFWDLLPAADRQLVMKMAAAATPTDTDAAQLAAALDKLIARDDFFDEKYFASLLSAAKLDQFKHRADKSADEVRRLNWYLLHEMFVNSVAAPHADLMPITIWHQSKDDPRVQLTSLGTSEAFIIWMKASLLAAFILASPLIFREIWLFVASGLYPHERRYVYIFLPFSVGLFLSGALMAFFVAFPPVLQFLLSYNDMLGINPEPRISEWLTFVLFLPLAFGIGFQLPLVMLFVNRIGLVSVKSFLVNWRVAILVICVAAVLLCPSPDIYSMMLMAAPMTVLYFGGIALCHYTTPRRPAALGGE
jgi:sec-independent protein translocase protein TatC